MKPAIHRLPIILSSALLLASSQEKEQSLSLLVPEINAISTLIFIVSVILILIWYQIRARTIGKEARELLERP